MRIDFAVFPFSNIVVGSCSSNKVNKSQYGMFGNAERLFLVSFVLWVDRGTSIRGLFCINSREHKMKL